MSITPSVTSDSSHRAHMGLLLAPRPPSCCQLGWEATVPSGPELRRADRLPARASFHQGQLSPSTERVIYNPADLGHRGPGVDSCHARVSGPCGSVGSLLCPQCPFQGRAPSRCSVPACGIHKGIRDYTDKSVDAPHAFSPLGASPQRYHGATSVPGVYRGTIIKFMGSQGPASQLIAPWESPARLISNYEALILH